MNQCVRGPRGCGRCDVPLPFDFTMAFQPIVDLVQARVTTFEALVRGPGGESAWSVISQVTDDLLYRFDQACRVRAIEIASRLGMRERLSINFLPNAVYQPEACIQATLEASHRVGWPTERIVFEFTETERVTDQAHLKHIIGSYRRMGFTTALDDFGNGYANLDLLTVLEPDKIKVDRELVMGCHQDHRRQALLRSIRGLATELKLEVIAEGVETREEALWLGRAGFTRQQGFFYARPQVESLGEDLVPMLTQLQAELYAEPTS